MTADEKLKIAQFLDIAADSLTTGYRGPARDYHFSDDSPVDTPMDAPVLCNEEKPGDSLQQISSEIMVCRACSLCETRTNAVPGEGASAPLVMVIGEGPGADEDAAGRPFVGRAGQLLDKMLDSIGLSRNSNCFIANVIKCRPPGNRDPRPEETAACARFLKRQIKLLKPQFILCVGRIAAHCVLNTTEPLARLRGKFLEFETGDGVIPLLVTYHPSALLRNEDLKRPAWEDLKMLKTRLGSGASHACGTDGEV